MIKKDIALIKKIVSRANDNSIVKCVTCYVDTKTDDIIFQKPKNFYSLEESQLSQYCNFMKKGVSGKLGSTVSEITTRENLLAAPRDNALENLEELEEIAQKVRDTLSIEDKRYCTVSGVLCNMVCACFLYITVQNPQEKKNQIVVWK